MSETPATAPTSPAAAAPANAAGEKKILLVELLARVELVAAGADAAGKRPEEEGHDPKTVPGIAERWCAAVLRIALSRVIEYVREFKRDIAGLKESVAKLEAAVKDLPAMREQLGEMTTLVGDIVQAIQASRTDGAPQVQPQPQPANAAPGGVPEGFVPASVTTQQAATSPEEALRQVQMEMAQQGTQAPPMPTALASVQAPANPMRTAKKAKNGAEGGSASEKV